MKIIIPQLTPHHNMLLFSFFYYCEKNNLDFQIQFNRKVSLNSGIIIVKNKTIYLDYSDSSFFSDNPNLYDFYFKRNLKEIDKRLNIFPLNFQVNYSYKSLKFLSKLTFNQLINPNNRIEIIRALDYFNMLTYSSHNAMDIRKLPNQVIDNGGKILFYTRLWNPDNHHDEDEKRRRRLQNEFRIESCRIIRKHFKNSSVGLFPDLLAKNMANDILLNERKTSKKEYFKLLMKHDIGIADDGLKDTPGWKIGEYLLSGKSVITTPLNIELDNFFENKNYIKLSTRNSFDEIPEKVELLLSGKKYLEIAQNNLEWSDSYLHPKNYISRILNITLMNNFKK